MLNGGGSGVTRLPAVRANQSYVQLNQRESVSSLHENYNFMTPQKVPVHLMQVGAKPMLSPDKRSFTSIGKMPMKVGLQDQLRSLKKQVSDASSQGTASMRTLGRSFKARTNMRNNEPLVVGQGLNNAESTAEFVNFEIQ